MDVETLHPEALVIAHPAIVTAAELHQWLLRAEPGAALLYHVGYLPTDRQRDSEVAETAIKANWLAETGRATLLQRRRGEHDYEYLIVKRLLGDQSSVMRGRA